jgi:hypothetical protein
MNGLGVSQFLLSRKWNIRMVQSTKEVGSKIHKKGKGILCSLMESHTKEYLRKVKSMDKESITTGTVTSTRATGGTMLNQVMGL